MNCYIDLDNTLLHSTAFKPVKLRSAKELNFGKNDVYYTFIRPSAKKVLRLLRNNFDTVCLLTTGIRSYALEANKILNLGFKHDQVFARDDYLECIRNAWMFNQDEYVPKKTNIDKDSVLIDDNYSEAYFAKLKKQFLGIPDKNYIQIPEYKYTLVPDVLKEIEEEFLTTINNLIADMV